MGEYFDWCNPDKNEYISPYDFDYGNKRYESQWEKNALLMSLFDLMENEWKGDRVIWMGDEGDRPDQEIPVISDFYRKMAKDGYFDFSDYEVEKMKNVSRHFTGAKEIIMEAYNQGYKEYGDKTDVEEYGLDLEDPEKGNFNRPGLWFRFVINETKKEYIDQHEKYYRESNCGISALPSLLSFGRTCNDGGPWLGDELRLSNEAPEEGYKFLTVKEVFENE